MANLQPIMPLNDSRAPDASTRRKISPLVISVFPGTIAICDDDSGRWDANESADSLADFGRQLLAGLSAVRSRIGGWKAALTQRKSLASR